MKVKRVTKTIIALLLALTLAFSNVSALSNEVKAHSIAVVDDIAILAAILAAAGTGYAISIGAKNADNSTLIDYGSKVLSGVKDDVIDKYVTPAIEGAVVTPALIKATWKKYTDGDLALDDAKKVDWKVIEGGKNDNDDNDDDNDGKLSLDQSLKISAGLIGLIHDSVEQYKSDPQSAYNTQPSSSSLMSNPWYEALKYYNFVVDTKINPIGSLSLFFVSHGNVTTPSGNKYKGVTRVSNTSAYVDGFYKFQHYYNSISDINLSQFNPSINIFYLESNGNLRFASVSLNDSQGKCNSFRINENTSYFYALTKDNYGNFNLSYITSGLFGAGSSVDFDGLFFNSLENAQAYFNSFVINSYDESYLANSPQVQQGGLAHQEIADIDALVEILKNIEQKEFSLKQLQDIYNNVTNNYQNYNTTNEYVTNAQQYVTNNNTTNNNTTNNNITNNYNFNDTNIVSGITKTNSILDTLVSYARTIGDSVTNLPAYCEQVLTDLGKVAHSVQQIVDFLADNPWPSPNPDNDPNQNPNQDPNQKPFEWPEFPPLEWPEFPPIEWPEFPPFSWPDFPPFSWPDFPPFSWPDYPPFEFPKFDDFKWPDIFPIDWDKLFDWFHIDTDRINDTIDGFENPVDFDDFKGVPIIFKNRYGTVTYPIFKMTTPDILKKFYPQTEIVLYDTNNHKDIFSKVRMIMTFCLYFGMCMWIVKFFKGQFIGGKGGSD